MKKKGQREKFPPPLILFIFSRIGEGTIWAAKTPENLTRLLTRLVPGFCFFVPIFDEFFDEQKSIKRVCRKCRNIP